jgi:hypothetical protein
LNVKLLEPQFIFYQKTAWQISVEINGTKVDVRVTIDDESTEHHFRDKDNPIWTPTNKLDNKKYRQTLDELCDDMLHQRLV